MLQSYWHCIVLKIHHVLVPVIRQKFQLICRYLHSENVPTRITTCGVVAQVLIWPSGEFVAILFAGKPIRIHTKIRLVSIVYMCMIYAKYLNNIGKIGRICFSNYTVDLLQHLRNRTCLIFSKAIVLNSMLMCIARMRKVVCSTRIVTMRKFSHSFEACGSCKPTVNVFDKKSIYSFFKSFFLLLKKIL